METKTDKPKRLRAGCVHYRNSGRAAELSCFGSALSAAPAPAALRPSGGTLAGCDNRVREAQQAWLLRSAVPGAYSQTLHYPIGLPRRAG
jgi:hypothetical protein